MNLKKINKKKKKCETVDGVPFFFDLLRVSFLLSSVMETGYWAANLVPVVEGPTSNISVVLSFAKEENIFTMPGKPPVFLDLLVQKIYNNRICFRPSIRRLPCVLSRFFSWVFRRKEISDCFFIPLVSSIKELEKNLQKLSYKFSSSRNLSEFEEASLEFSPLADSFQKAFSRSISPNMIEGKGLFAKFFPFLHYLPSVIATFNYWSKYSPTEKNVQLAEKLQLQRIYQIFQSLSFQEMASQVFASIDEVPAVEKEFTSFYVAINQFCADFIDQDGSCSGLSSLVQKYSPQIISSARDLLQRYTSFVLAN